MKSIYKYMVLAMMVGSFAGCDEDAIDPLTGKYAVPEEYTLTSMELQETEKLDSGNRVFTIEMSGDGNTLTVDFVSSVYYLVAETYTIADDNTTALTYTNAYWTAADGSSTNAQLVSGSLSVESDDNESYTVSGALTLDNDLVIRITATGTLVFEADAEPTALTQVLSVSDNTAYGTNTVTLYLATSDVSYSYDATTYTVTYSGTGYYLAVDFYSEDGTLAAGTYTPADADNCAAGNYVMGYDPGDIYGIGYEFTDWGTCWWTVSNGTTSATHIEEGEIVVEKTGSLYTITIDNSVCYAEFSGVITGLASDDSSEETSSYTYTDVVSEVTSFDWTTWETTTIEGVEYHTITVMDADGSTVAAFEAVIEEGGSLAGTYTIAESPTSAYLMNNGWDLSAYGYGSGGTYFYEDGVQYLVTAGTITVTDSDGVLSFYGTGLTTTSVDDGSTGPTSLAFENVSE